VPPKNVSRPAKISISQVLIRIPGREQRPFGTRPHKRLQRGGGGGKEKSPDVSFTGDFGAAAALK